MNTTLIIILVIILVIIYLLNSKEGFGDCIKYSNNYNTCYDSGCTVMIGTNGQSFCTER